MEVNNDMQIVSNTIYGGSDEWPCCGVKGLEKSVVWLDRAEQTGIADRQPTRIGRQSPISRAMSEPARAHVLVVDDEPLAARVLADFLARKGYRVTTARDGHEGLVKYRSDPADVVITDVRMPRLDGWKLVQAVRRETPAAYIIVVTGYPGTEDKELAAEARADVVMRKPLDLRAISRTIETYIGDAG